MPKHKEIFPKAIFEYKGQLYEGYAINWKHLLPAGLSEHHVIRIIVCPKLKLIFKQDLWESRGGGSKDNIKVLLDYSITEPEDDYLIG